MEHVELNLYVWLLGWSNDSGIPLTKARSALRRKLTAYIIVYFPNYVHLRSISVWKFFRVLDNTVLLLDRWSYKAEHTFLSEDISTFCVSWRALYSRHCTPAHYVHQNHHTFSKILVPASLLSCNSYSDIFGSNSRNNTRLLLPNSIPSEEVEGRRDFERSIEEWGMIKDKIFRTRRSITFFFRRLSHALVAGVVEPRGGDLHDGDIIMITLRYDRIRQLSITITCKVCLIRSGTVYVIKAWQTRQFRRGTMRRNLFKNLFPRKASKFNLETFVGNRFF